MAVTRWDSRFFETTRGRILALLRRGSRTVDELAQALGITDNAVRPHIAALERDGVVQQKGMRPTGRKPAYAYEVVPEAERLFTRAYIPVLTQLIWVLAEHLSHEQLRLLLGNVGKRLAASQGPPSGDIRARANVAATVLTELGGVVDVEEQDGVITLRGFSCPLADAVCEHPDTCHAIESLVEELVGVPVRERCDRIGQPRCCFELAAEARKDSR